MKRLLAVLGKDVRFSLSPHLHMAASEACQLGLAYVPLNCPTELDFFEMLTALRLLKARGCNVTIPYKSAAFELADECTPVAKELGVANTLTFEGDKILADNTDGPGLKRVLEGLDQSCFRRVQILGAGGAARAAVWALRELGAKEVVVCARRNADAVSGLASDIASASPLRAVDHVSLIISSLPKSSALAQKVLTEWMDLSDQPTVVDLAYGGLDSLSPLAAKVKARQLFVLDGRGMLVEQAAISLNGWIGGQVSEKIRKAMWEALG